MKSSRSSLLKNRDSSVSPFLDQIVTQEIRYSTFSVRRLTLQNDPSQDQGWDKEGQTQAETS